MSVGLDTRASDRTFAGGLRRRALFWSGGPALALWLVLVSGVHLWGEAINERFATKILAPPLTGRFVLHIPPAVLLPIAVAAGIVWFGPRSARASEWRLLLVVALLASGAWSTSLGLVGGTSSLAAPLEGSHDYLVNVDRVESPGAFVATYSEDLSDYSLHAQGHPPGLILLLWSMDRMGLSGPGPATALIIAAGASVATAALVALRAAAGEDRARRAAPFLVLAPAAVWMVTSGDALFAATSAWGLALLALGAQRRSDGLALAGGGLLGAALFLTYGVAPLGVVALALALVHRRTRPLFVAAVGVAAVVTGFTVAGFWWFAGLDATIGRYELGVAAQRPFGYFAIANLAAFALALGPAVAVAFTRLRDRRTWLVVGAALVAVAAVDLTGYSKGEVERIWLVFVPWFLLACSAFDLNRVRGMLALQAAVAVAIQIGVRTPW